MKVTLKGEDTFEMAMSPNQKDIWPGGFGTDIGVIKDKDYVRNTLAVKENWKPDIDRIVQYRVKEGVEVPAQKGMIGPQIDVESNKYLPGGGNQVELLIPGDKRMDYLEIIGKRYLD